MNFTKMLTYCKEKQQEDKDGIKYSFSRIK